MERESWMSDAGWESHLAAVRRAQGIEPRLSQAKVQEDGDDEAKSSAEGEVGNCGGGWGLPIETNPSGEARQFRMHPELLWSVIEAQAGTVEKALLEGVMNAVDAGSATVEIALDEQGFKISDNGRGFGSRQEIEDFFEVFGTPHKEGDATYGRFRMGRGQLFSFAETVWRSGMHRMHVDIKRRGLAYTLEETCEEHGGCEVVGRWYSRLQSNEVHRAVVELKQLCAWMQVDVSVNGEQISSRASDGNWDIETDDAYIKFTDSGGLAVYNLGALVRVYGSDKFGVSGTVVSKRALQVNFARNDILVNKCGVWKKVREVLKTKWLELANKRSLDPSQRYALIEAIIAKELPIGMALKAKLLVDAAGKQRSLNDLCRGGSYTESPISVCVVSRDKARVGERIMECGLGLALMDSCLLEWNVPNLERFFRLLQSLGYHGYFKWTTPDNLAPQIKSRYKIIESTSLPKHLVAMLKGFQEAADKIGMVVYALTEKERGWVLEGDLGYPRFRRIVFGESDTALAWTDGSSYIAVHIDLARSILAYGTTVYDVGKILLHEYCHQGSDEQQHDHGHEFYELFHDTLMKADWHLHMQHVSSRIAEGYRNAAALVGLRPRKRVTGAASSVREGDPLMALGRPSVLVDAMNRFPLEKGGSNEGVVAKMVIEHVLGRPEGRAA